jgi:hypothetical protein
MSRKCFKGGASSRTEEAETGSLGKLREGLPEIGIHSFKDWDTIIIPKLKDKLRDGTQDLKSICKDPLKTEKVAAYILYERPRASAADLASLQPEEDPHGIQRMLFQEIWSSLNQAYQQRKDKQDEDKAMVYILIRSLLSAQLNALLKVDDEFRECPDDDPLRLLEIIKRLISTRVDGYEELDRQKALGEWLTLTMKHGEKIVDYGRRALKTFDRLAITGIPEAEHPKPKQQSMRFIDGLDSSMPAYRGYKLYLINSKQQTGTDIYPDTLVDAIKRSTLFEASWTATTEPSPLTSLPLKAFGAQGAHGDKRPKGGKTPGKGKGDKGKNPSAKDKKDGTVKIGDKPKCEGECYNFGKYGHRKAECRSKAKTESTPSQHTKYVKQARPLSDANKHDSFYSAFGSMPDDGNENCDDLIRRCNLVLMVP